MMKAQFASLVAASALALAGCGGGAKSGTEAAASPSPAPMATASTAVDTDEPAARAFVDTLFAAYAKDGEPNLFAKPAETFEPELAAAIAKLDERTEKTGTIGASQEADPICACQDYGDVSHSIDSVAIDGTKAKAVVTFTNFGKSEKRTLDLVATPAGWRIFDIDTTYRKAVFDDLKQP
jgi:hypothetical protein